MAMTKGARAESLLRGASVVLAAAAALLVGLDAETKQVLFIRRKAGAKDVEALWVLYVAAAAAAGYQLLQLLRCFYLSRCAENPSRSSKKMAWTCFLLDKGCTYLLFATTIAAAQACMVALKGVPVLQWSKLCNVYTRFCHVIAGGLLCSLLASLSMAVLSSLSARSLFALYAPSAAHRHGSCALL